MRDIDSEFSETDRKVWDPKIYIDLFDDDLSNYTVYDIKNGIIYSIDIENIVQTIDSIVY